MDASETPTLPSGAGAPGGAGEHEAGELGPYCGGIRPGEERAHAVAEEEDRQARLLLAGACR